LASQVVHLVRLAAVRFIIRNNAPTNNAKGTRVLALTSLVLILIRHSLG